MSKCSCEGIIRLLFLDCFTTQICLKFYCWSPKYHHFSWILNVLGWTPYKKNTNVQKLILNLRKRFKKWIVFFFFETNNPQYVTTRTIQKQSPFNSPCPCHDCLCFLQNKSLQNYKHYFQLKRVKKVFCFSLLNLKWSKNGCKSSLGSKENQNKHFYLKTDKTESPPWKKKHHFYEGLIFSDSRKLFLDGNRQI